MEIQRWFAFGFAALFLVAAGSPEPAAAKTPDLSGRSSTVFEWYSVAGGDKVTPFYQYLLLNGRDLDGAGLDFKGYGRLAESFDSDVDVDSRLYYAYLEKKRLANGNLDVKLGRQFMATTAGASVMDGLLLKLKGPNSTRFSLYGGGDVSYYKGYNAKDLIFGAEVRGKLPGELNLGFSYLQKREDSDITHELFGLDGDYDYRNILNLYSELQFNYIVESVSYFLAGANYHRSSDWSLRTEYLYSLPVFSSTSIYSVFAVSEYEELMGELRYRLDTGLYGFARYQYEMYDETANARVFEAGIEKIRTDSFSGYLSGVLRDDKDGQDLKG
ncbi:MAG: hypothetical protein RQ753_07060, partial [Desulfurivibrionaceae bacterium]|nr:hypothetical protein [Desulfurivibrionaceae bacterium]